MVVFCCVSALLAGSLLAASAAGTTYYISAFGNDSNSGKSSTEPWSSLTKLNETTFGPGDTISFKRGDIWAGGITLDQSGTADSPITINTYGEGPLPSIEGGLTGNCVTLTGDHVIVDGLQTISCGYAGFSISGDHTVVRNSGATRNAVGLKVSSGSDFGLYKDNVFTNNNVMNALTRGTGCGTPEAAGCEDDSGAFGFLINGNDNEFAGNTISGSNAFSHDFGRDGGAFEIYNGNRNRIHHNTSVNNNNFSEIGVSDGGTADGNSYGYNVITSNCGANCTESKGLIVRGSGSTYGPNTNTTFQYNTVWLAGRSSQAVVCHASCPESTVIWGNILVSPGTSLWLDGTGWTERYNVLNGPRNVKLDKTSTTAAAGFVKAPSDLRLTAGSPAIDRVKSHPSVLDLGPIPPLLNGDCAGPPAADAGAFEFDPPDC